MEIKEVIDALDPKLKEHKEAIAEQVKGIEKTVTEKLADQAAAIEQVKESVRESKSAPAPVAAKGFAGELNEKLTANHAKLVDYKNSKKGFSIDLESKAVGNMASSTSLTGTYFVPPTVVPGVSLKPFETVHMRDLIPVGSTNSNVVRFVVDNGGEGGPAMVAEAGTKPQIDRDLEIKDANVRKIATYFRVPEEMVEDISYLTSFLSQVGIEEVMVIEDNQVLYGDGTGQNLSGFNTLGTAFAAGTSVIGATANNFDVIGAAKKQLRNAKFGGSLIALVNPTDYFDMRWKKDTAANYLFQSNQGVTPLQIDGVTILEHTAVTAGGFFVFSPRAAQIFDRAGASVRFYDQDQDNAIKNLVTIVIEKRLALPIYYPTAIIRGTFATAITDLTS
jgi:HK97 family phage major capsid protein